MAVVTAGGVGLSSGKRQSTYEEPSRRMVRQQLRVPQYPSVHAKTLKGTLPRKDSTSSAPEEHDIAHDGPVLDVEEVKSDSVLP